AAGRHARDGRRARARADHQGGRGRVDALRARGGSVVSPIILGIVASGFRVGGGGPEPPAGTVEYPGIPGVFATLIESAGQHSFPQIDTSFPQTIGRAPFTSRAAFFAFKVRGPFAVQKIDATFDAYFYVTDSSGAAIVDGDGGAASTDRLVC